MNYLSHSPPPVHPPAEFLRQRVVQLIGVPRQPDTGRRALLGVWRRAVCQAVQLTGGGLNLPIPHHLNRPPQFILRCHAILSQWLGHSSHHSSLIPPCPCACADAMVGLA